MNQLEQFQLISDAAEKFNKSQHIKPSVETSFMEGAYWANKTMLQEVLKWLDENFYDVHVLLDDRAGLESAYNNLKYVLDNK